jgi:hypothetical protein
VLPASVFPRAAPHTGYRAGRIEYWVAGVKTYFDAMGDGLLPSLADYPVTSHETLKAYDANLLARVEKTMAYKGYVDWRFKRSMPESAKYRYTSRPRPTTATPARTSRRNGFLPAVQLLEPQTLSPQELTCQAVRSPHSKDVYADLHAIAMRWVTSAAQPTECGLTKRPGPTQQFASFLKRYVSSGQEGDEGRRLLYEIRSGLTHDYRAPFLADTEIVSMLSPAAEQQGHYLTLALTSACVALRNWLHEEGRSAS